MRLYRAMKEDTNGQPVLGCTEITLGVRPNVDLPIDPHGVVSPGTAVYPSRRSIR
jgi:hypothetical protein